ncbi:THO complex subunit 3 [Scaptodrosophila lebanonensis]|uniref:THO complex subunit 3 n=1 Tax=Drosophila lebanonensis TaxID=7225 RepID=A0A6J2TL10_DROLE|nr:THO complex subunit 3 [Scaptodrosophila lebanonensis]
MNRTEATLEDLKSYFRSHSKIREQRAHMSKVHSVCWNADGRHLASGSFDKTVAVYSLERDRFIKGSVYRGHTASVDQLCWHKSNPDLFSTASGDKTVRMWDIRVGCVSVTNTKGENINIAWSPDGKTIAVGNKEDLITFIDTRTNKIRVEEPFSFEVNEISWNNTNDLFFLTNGMGCMHVLSYPSLEHHITLKAHPANCICIEFGPTGKYFATGSADAQVSLWDANELACLRMISRLEWPVRTISFSHDERLIASASEDLLIDIAYTETGERVTDIHVDASTFTVAWHPKQYLLAYACDEKELNRRDRDAGNVKIYGFPE